MSKKSVSDLMRPLPVLQLLGGPLPGITGFLSSPRLEGVAASLSAASVPGVGGVAPGQDGGAASGLVDGRLGFRP